MSRATATDLVYLIAIVGFILALKGLSSPKRARLGNLVGAAGMIIAVAWTFSLPEVHSNHRNLALIIVGMVVGTAIAVPAARFVKMTAMPQMVAIFNGVGGGAAALVSPWSSFLALPSKNIAIYKIVEILLGVLIGSVSFSGSAIAFAKLQELVTGRPITYPGQQLINGLVGLAILGARRRHHRHRQHRAAGHRAGAEPGARCHLRPPHRRSGRPGAHLAAQRLHRSGRRRLRASPSTPRC